ncbi:MAG: helix-turn-helix transcriptional regulator [Asticcacaulis sp.]|uniref:helix-turn-helix domain-containing protein n=1 Tax=Asticcacaulis sp. TaxID=1872648 RepID=UPI0039E64A89
MSAVAEGPNPVDIHVGARVRSRRKAMGLSQEALAETLGLTFQQVQKYERGANRISASKLYEISRTLKVPLAFFYDGYTDTPADPDFVESASERSVNDFLTTAEGIELSAVFPKLKSAAQRRKILELVRTLADDSTPPS